jgi:hypothetical protein
MPDMVLLALRSNLANAEKTGDEVRVKRIKKRIAELEKAEKAEARAAEKVEPEKAEKPAPKTTETSKEG